MTEAQVEQIERGVWRDRADFPHDPYCFHCGAGQQWASKHGHGRDCPITALAQLRAREPAPIGHLLWPSLEFLFNGPVERIGALSVNAQPIPVYAAPQPAQDCVIPEESCPVFVGLSDELDSIAAEELNKHPTAAWIVKRAATVLRQKPVQEKKDPLGAWMPKPILTEDMKIRAAAYVDGQQWLIENIWEELFCKPIWVVNANGLDIAKAAAAQGGTK